MGKAQLRVHHVGPLPIIQHFLDRMTFRRIVTACLWSPRREIVDHARTLSILISNMLLSPSPLYRIAEWADPFSDRALGLSLSEKASINDDRIARSLDALVSVRSRSLFFRLALHVIKEFELETRQIHNDTTTVTFHGAYRTSRSEPMITQGLNKDHRPDLKQLVFGVNITADGAVPLSHDVYSGNRTDDTIHRSTVDYLRQLLGRDDFIYVADCKLATRKNLRHIDSYGGKFVTVLPRTRSEDQLFRNKLRQGQTARWRRLLVLENKRRQSDPPDVYWTTSAAPTKTEEGYRIIWCRSSQKAEHDALARNERIKAAELELFDLATRINRGRLQSRSAIARRAKAVLRQHDCLQFLKVKVQSSVHVEYKRLRRGRPRRTDSFDQLQHRVFRLSVERDKNALRAESRTDGVFPLVTNLGPNRAPKRQVLLIYKYQPYVEKRHALLKSELEVAPVYLKKPSRVAGLIHAMYLVMMVDALIERTLRQAMKREGLESLPILPEGRQSKTPTTARILEMFTGICWYEFERGGETITFPIELTPLQRQLLALLGIDRSVYS
jgi:transposase